MVTEHRTSITSPCNYRTTEHQIPVAGIVCDHPKRMKHDVDWVQSTGQNALNGVALGKEEGTLNYLTSFRDCDDLYEKQNLCVIRHRVCPHCVERYANGSLRNNSNPGQITLPTYAIADSLITCSSGIKTLWQASTCAAFFSTMLPLVAVQHGTCLIGTGCCESPCVRKNDTREIYKLLSAFDTEIDAVDQLYHSSSCLKVTQITPPRHA
ncbi:hypothetical protein NQZ79_g7212 [Umbelopsis isabellina]|nr:hypothetical protein NQZ79_g7212 [Umbelopsis isabellina]